MFMFSNNSLTSNKIIRDFLANALKKHNMMNSYVRCMMGYVGDAETEQGKQINVWHFISLKKG